MPAAPSLPNPTSLTDRKKDAARSWCSASAPSALPYPLNAIRKTLLETILVEARAIAHADGGTLYFLKDGRELEFAILHNDTLEIRLGGTSPEKVPLPPLHLHDPETGNPNYHTQAIYSVLKKRPINIEDAYHADGFDF